MSEPRQTRQTAPFRQISPEFPRVPRITLGAPGVPRGSRGETPSSKFQTSSSRSGRAWNSSNSLNSSADSPNGVKDSKNSMNPFCTPPPPPWGEIPSPKFQAPIKFQTSNSKKRKSCPDLLTGAPALWVLESGASLEFGNWNLELVRRRAYATPLNPREIRGISTRACASNRVLRERRRVRSMTRARPRRVARTEGAKPRPVRRVGRPYVASEARGPRRPTTFERVDFRLSSAPSLIE